MSNGFKFRQLVTISGKPDVLYRVIKSDMLRTIVLPVDAGAPETYETEKLEAFTVPTAL